MSWTEFLPPSLQLSTLYWIIAVCWSVGYFCRNLPLPVRTDLVTRWAVLCAGMETAIWMMPASTAYALGTGLIASTISTLSYDLILGQIEILLTRFAARATQPGPLDLPRPSNNLPQPPAPPEPMKNI